MNTQKEKKWTLDREISWEMALDAIKEIRGILVRSRYFSDNEEEKQKLRERSLEIFKETDKFDMYDDEIVKAVNDTYWPLIRAYFEDPRSEKELVAAKYYERFLNTKVDYNAFKK